MTRLLAGKKKPGHADLIGEEYGNLFDYAFASRDFDLASCNALCICAVAGSL